MPTSFPRPTPASALRRPRAWVAAAVAAVLGLGAAAHAQNAYQWQWDDSEAAEITVLSNDKDDGYLIIVNNDNSEMSLDINVGSRTIYLRRDNSGAGMFTLPEGGEFPLRVRKGDYKMYWGVGDNVQVKVRNGQTTTLAFDAYGRDGTGLRAVVHDGERLREYTLYESGDAYRQAVVQETYAIRDGRAPRVIVTSTPVVMVERRHPPKPPSVALWVGGAVRILDAVSRLVDGNRNHRDDRWGYGWSHNRNNKWKRVHYDPRPPVIVQPSRPVHRPPVVVQPSRPVHRPPVVVQPSRPVHRPPVVVQPSRPVHRPPVVVQPSRPVHRPPVVVQPSRPTHRPPQVAPQPPQRPGQGGGKPGHNPGPGGHGPQEPQRPRR